MANEKKQTVEVTGTVKDDSQESPHRHREVPGSDVPVSDAEDTTVPLVRVHIKRDLEKISTVVMAHEVDILRAVHGEDRVEVDDDYDAGEAEIPQDADSEYQRLVRKYDRRNLKVVGAVFRNPDDLAKVLGVSRSRSGAKQAQSLEKVRRPVKKSAKK